MNPKLQVGKEMKDDKQSDWALIMQGVKPSSWTKKLANVNMPNILLELGKGSKVRKFVLGMDNY